MRYPVVLFDVGETLVGPRESFGAVYARVLATLGISLPEEALERGIRRSISEMNRILPAGTDRYRHFGGGEREYWVRFATRVIELAGGAAPDPELAKRATERLGAAFRKESAWRVFDDTLPALNRLKEEGVRLGIVSNWDSNLPRVLDLLGLSPYFETVGVSHIEGLEKPAPAFFLRVLERMGAEPGQALHVGDSAYHDGEGAGAARIDAVLVVRQGAVAPGFHGIRSLAEVPQIARKGLDRLPADRSRE